MSFKIMNVAINLCVFLKNIFGFYFLPFLLIFMYACSIKVDEKSYVYEELFNQVNFVLFWFLVFSFNVGSILSQLSGDSQCGVFFKSSNLKLKNLIIEILGFQLAIGILVLLLSLIKGLPPTKIIIHCGIILFLWFCIEW